MPHGMDVADDSGTAESAFECLECGSIVHVGRHPGRCEQCGGVLQNRAKSLE